MTRYYTAPDGVKYPLTEAPYSMSFTIYRSDRHKAHAGDPHSCLIAMGIKRNRDVKDVFIGTGRDAYVVFHARDDQPAHAVHFVLGMTTRRVIDAFDLNKRATTMKIELKRPTKGRTLEVRRTMDKSRRQKIKDGAHTVKKRATPQTSRMRRLGIAHRPRPQISNAGNVSAAE
jgi:hypothetical protein